MNKIRHLNQKLSEYLNDMVSSYTIDGAVYSSQKRDEYLNRAMTYLFRFAWNLSSATPKPIEIFVKIFPDLVKRVNKTTTSNQPARFVLDTTTRDLFQIVSVMDTTSKEILTPISPEHLLIAESNKNTIFSFTLEKPAYSLISETIYFVPVNYTNRSFDMIYIKSPVQDNGNVYSSYGNFDIPFKPEFYEVILQTAKAFAMFDSQEINYGQLLLQLSLIENSLIKGG